MTRSKTESQLAEAYRWAIREGGKVSPRAGLVLCTLLTYVDLETGIAFPKRSTVARDLYATENPTKGEMNTISNCITMLVDANLLTREQMTNGNRLVSNVYRLKIGNKARTVPTIRGRAVPTNDGHGKPTNDGHANHRIVGTNKYPVEVSNQLSTLNAGRHLKVVK